MIGTLTTSTGGISVRLPPPNTTRSTTVKTSSHGVLHAYPAVDRPVKPPETLYEVLRVERNATPTEIKTAYRSLAKIYHPDASDCNQHGDREFIEIRNAYATLSDPATRAMYDLKWSSAVRRRSGLYTVAGERRGFYTCRRWETDQCW